MREQMSARAAWREKRLIRGAKGHELAASDGKALREWYFPVKKAVSWQKLESKTKNNLRLNTRQMKRQERGCTVNPDEMLRETGSLECCCGGAEPMAEHVQKLRRLGGGDGNRIIWQAVNSE